METTKDPKFGSEPEQRMEWISVPAFGEWDQKQQGGGGVPDYSMDFSKIREMRRQHKRDPSRASMGNEEELLRRPADDPALHQSDILPRPQRRVPTVVMAQVAVCEFGVGREMYGRGVHINNREEVKVTEEGMTVCYWSLERRCDVRHSSVPLRFRVDNKEQFAGRGINEIRQKVW